MSKTSSTASSCGVHLRKIRLVSSSSSSSSWLIQLMMMMLLLLFSVATPVTAFSLSPFIATSSIPTRTRTLLVEKNQQQRQQHSSKIRQQLYYLSSSSSSSEEDHGDSLSIRNRATKATLLPTVLLCSALCFGTPLTLATPASAVADTSISGDAVSSALQSLRDASGQQQRLYESYEQIAQIITEGKGVGGSVNYKGVQLERGYVADEDTSIYNPGLVLLTESEKSQLVQAVIQSRQECFKQSEQSVSCWSEDNQLAYDFLREKLDPLHMVELRPYLGIFPFYVAVVYAGVLAVQQLVRELFPVAYLVGVAVVVAPALLLLALGPQ